MSWLSAMLGLDALHNASVLSNQAKGYRQQAGQGFAAQTPLYQNLSNAGASDYNTYANLFLPYLNQLNYTAGIPGTIGGSLYNLPMTETSGGAAQQLNAPSYTPIGAVTGQAAGTGQRLGGQSPANRVRAGMVGTPNRATPPPAGTQANTAAPAAARDMTSSGATTTPGAASPMGEMNWDAYDLTPAQHVQLSNQVGVINTAANAAIDEYRRQFAGRGQPVPPEGEALIREHFATQAQNARAGFAEAARANRQQTIGQVLDMLQGLGGRGEGVYGAGVQGLGNIAQNYAGLAGQTQAESAQQSGTAFNNLMGVLGLAGYAAGGGFNRLRYPNLGQVGTPPIATGNTTLPVLAPMVGAGYGTGPSESFPTLPWSYFSPTGTYQPPGLGSINWGRFNPYGGSY